MEEGTGGIEYHPPTGTHPNVTMPVDDVNGAVVFIFIAILFAAALSAVETVFAIEKKKKRKWPPPPPSKDS